LKLTFFIAGLLCFAFTVAASANQFESCRCPKGIASKGDSKQEVLSECGTPLRTESGSVTIRGKRIYVEKWVYNFGPNEFMQSIAFDYNNNQVVVVESLQKGF